MRSTNKRSRSKSNRPKTLGNIVNRVFDSSGPEGKVRGTPQQIIEKYQVLARDAQLSNDRVAAENFQQHAEHYTRLLAQAMREQQAEQEARRLQQEDRNRGQNDDRGQGQRRHEPRRNADGSQQNGDDARDMSGADAFALQDNTSSERDQGTLVETPETARHEQPAPVLEPHATGASSNPDETEAAGADVPKPPARRQPRARKPNAGEGDGADAKSAPKPARNTRKPRKPASETAKSETAKSETAKSEKAKSEQGDSVNPPEAAE
ncbi:MAG: DUF4167 domain-containing protein [Rhodobacteraceae bacterium]|nr:MAG: DUF4167 domain-containing protein [Paracoccaceae bacterium]